MSYLLWNQLASSAGLSLTAEQSAALEDYLELLAAGNQRMNLTRIVDRDQARVQHIADALTLLQHLPRGPHTLVDVGSGGGVPGIPMAIVRPDVAVTLVESVAKKAAFLNEARQALSLGNVVVWRGRAEEWRGSGFDVLTCRAVAPMDKLLPWCRPLAAPGGRLLAMKGPRAVEELNRAQGVLRGQGAVVTTHPVDASALSGHAIIEVRWDSW